MARQSGGKPIAERALLDVLTRAEAANAGQPITFFEITSAAAFLAFAEHPGRYRAAGDRAWAAGSMRRTSSTRPMLTVITPISIDHTSFLGDTHRSDRGRKGRHSEAGCPCIVSRQTDMAQWA